MTVIPIIQDVQNPSFQGQTCRRFGQVTWCMALALLVACSGMPTASVSSPTPTLAPAIVTPTLAPTVSLPRPTATALPPNKVGIHLLLGDGRNAWPVKIWPNHVDYARELVGEWGYVTELVRLDILFPARWQTFFDLCAELHLTPILRLATTYDREKGLWLAPPADSDGGYAKVAGRYARFVSALRWPSAPHYVIVGNEPNHGDEWGGQADPAAYARFLVEVSRALHQADPDVLVLNAPLDPFTPNTNGQPFTNGMTYLDAESFLDGMYAAQPDVFAAVDVWASHAYPMGPMTEGPWQQSFEIDLLNGAHNPSHVEPPPGICNRGVNGYEWELFKLESYGVHDLQVMITESGWRHSESTDPDASDNGRPLPDAVTVAGFVDLAFNGNCGRYPQWPETGWTPWQADPRVIAVTLFALNGKPREWGHTNWLQLDIYGRVLGVYPMFETLRDNRALFCK